MRIPDATIDQVRLSVDIVEVISAHVALKKRGKNYVGLCPFHTEKTPSFTVSSDKQMYHCFGCGKGGNVFTFLMDIEKVSFVEAVRSLAERAGIPVPQEESGGPGESESERIYDACRFAGLFFYKGLTESDAGKPALDYVNKRGFTPETIKSFGLGYAPDSWDALLTRAQKEGMQTEDLLRAGLIRARDEGGYYDYFRHRLMFPIFSTSGRVIGFGARKLREEDTGGKYLNSPETPVYSKGRTLFGLFQSREAIRTEGKAVLVEGYADLITLFQEGVQNVVASGGTALTADQALLVKRYTGTLTLLFDADTAGSAATVRGVDVALENGLDVEVATLSEGEDPDQFVRRHGVQALRERLAQAVSFIDFKASELRRAGMFSSPERQAEAVRSIVQTIAKINDELKRSFFIKEVAQKYEIYESVLHRELERWVPRQRPRATAPVRSAESATRESSVDVQTPQPTAVPAAEQDLLRLFLESRSDVTQFILSNLSLSDLQDTRIRSLAEMALARIEETGSCDAGSLVNEIQDPALKGLLTEVTLSRYELSKGWRDMEAPIDTADPFEVARDALLVVKRSALQKQMEENQKQLKEASLRGEDVARFVQHHQDLARAMKEVATLFGRREPEQPVSPPENGS
jgi:DNA primase